VVIATVVAKGILMERHSITEVGGFVDAARAITHR
jgi:hypothetical protein